MNHSLKPENRIPLSSDLIALSIFVILAAYVLLIGFYHRTGLISPDGSNYLALAQNLLLGNGFYINSTFNQMAMEPVWFAVWPVGYPFLIFLVAKLTGFSVYWSAKVLSVLLLAIAVFLFRKMIGKYYFLAAMLIVHISFLPIYAGVYSESLFLVCMLLFCMSLSGYIARSLSIQINKGCPIQLLKYLTGIVLALLGMFLSRYLGVAAFAVLGIAILYLFYQGKHAYALVLSVIAFLAGLVVLAYLYHNYLQTGFMTGVERIPAPESLSQLVVMWVRGLLDGFVPVERYFGAKAAVILLGQLVVVLAVFLLVKFKRPTWLSLKPLNKMAYSKELILVVLLGLLAVTYLILVTYMRFNSHFDDFNGRILAPFFWCLFVAAVLLMANCLNNQLLKVVSALAMIFFVWILFYKPIPDLHKQMQTSSYNEYASSLIGLYQEVPQGAWVSYASDHMRYLRPDLHLHRPFAKPYQASMESWQAYQVRLDAQGEKLHWIQLPIKLSPYKEYDPSIYVLVDQLHLKYYGITEGVRYKPHMLVPAPSKLP